MSWHFTYTNFVHRPRLLDGESIRLVRDNIGLYNENTKIPHRQNGRIYLTNIRLIFVQSDAVYINLCNVLSTSKIDGFLTSSPKIKLILGDEVNYNDNIFFICKICSYKNSINSSRNSITSSLVCSNCGIKAKQLDLVNAGKKQLDLVNVGSKQLDLIGVSKQGGKNGNGLNGLNGLNGGNSGNGLNGGNSGNGLTGLNGGNSGLTGLNGNGGNSGFTGVTGLTGLTGLNGGLGGGNGGNSGLTGFTGLNGGLGGGKNAAGGVIAGALDSVGGSAVSAVSSVRGGDSSKFDSSAARGSTSGGFSAAGSTSGGFAAKDFNDFDVSSTFGASGGGNTSSDFGAADSGSSNSALAKNNSLNSNGSNTALNNLAGLDGNLVISSNDNSRVIESFKSSRAASNEGSSLAQSYDSSNLNSLLSLNYPSNLSLSSAKGSNKTNSCPTCTFINHISMKNCEICGTGLKQLKPVTPTNSKEKDPTYIKVSFHKGGETEFYQILNSILDEIKWNSLQKDGKINQNSIQIKEKEIELRNQPIGGISGLEAIGELQRKKNEDVLTNSLNDVDQLMFKFNDLIKLTKNKVDIVQSQSILLNSNSPMYLLELSRHICEYCLTLFKKKSSMITSQDLFAGYNRYLINSQGFGIDLISVQDFSSAIASFTKLDLPLKSKKYANGLVVVTYNNIDSYNQFVIDYVGNNYPATIAGISDHFNWAYNITIEEIDKCVELGKVVIDYHISGNFYYLNDFGKW